LPLKLHGDAVDTLQLRNPLPTPDALQWVGFGNGKFIATDSRGDVFSSENAEVWMPVGNVGTNLLIRIVYGSGRYVAYSFAGDIFSSEDGAVWTSRASLHVINSSPGLTYGNGLFLAVGDVTLSSPDGITWTTQSNVCDCVLTSVTYGNGTFAAVGIANSIYTSADGVMWTPHLPDVGYGVGQSIAYGNGTFVVSGGRLVGTSVVPGVWQSSNGVDWVRVSGAGLGVGGLVYGGGTFLAWDTTAAETSSDGVTWTTNALPAGLSLGRVAFGNGVFVGVAPGSIGRSPNGIDWTKVPVPAADRGFISTASAYGAGRYVLVGGWPLNGGEGSVVISPDGTNFSRITDSAIPALGAVTYAAGQFVAVGYNGGMVRSADGTTWSASRSGTLNTLRAIAHGAASYVAVGDGGIIRVSRDGVVWNGAASGTDYSLYGVAFGNGKFVAVGQLGIVLASGDGVTWTPQDNSDFSPLYQVIYAEGRFIAVGGGGTVLTSSDGSVWIRQTTGLTNTINNITYGGGLYVAVSTVGRVFTSGDGLTWRERLQPDFGRIAGAAFLNSTLLLFGVGGTILQSDAVTAVALKLAINPATGMQEVKVASDAVGATYRLQACTNLTTGAWLDVKTFAQTEREITIILPDIIRSPQCYYRAVTP